jgi:hypothetical protein
MHPSDAASTGTIQAHRRRPPRGRTKRATLIGVLAGILGLATLLGSAFGATGGTPPAAAAAAPPATPNANCTLTVPANPLSAKGLATPYLLTATDPAQGPCQEANTAQSAFVQATVVDPATGAIAVYNPLVIDQGTKAAVAPVLPKFPAGAVVGIWFGFNAGTLTLRSSQGSLRTGHCVNGLNGSLFTQFAYCNAPAFFSAANRAERAGRLKVPPLGTGKDGKPCLSTRDFGLIDQDQSDNVTTDYLATAAGTLAQKTALTVAAQPASVSLANGSDNLLLTAFVDPALGCTPYTAPDLADPGHNVTSLGLDELQAAAFQRAPIALVPVNDPMAQVNGATSRAKTNLYRAGVDMPALSRRDTGDPLAYCASLATTGLQRINADKAFFTGAASPQAGQNLFDFLTARFTASLTNLNCPQASAAASASASASTSTAPSASASAAASGPAKSTSAAPSASVSPSTAASASAAKSASASATAVAAGSGAPAVSASPSSGSVQAIGVPVSTSAPAVVQVHDTAPSPVPVSASSSAAAPMTTKASPTTTTAAPMTTSAAPMTTTIPPTIASHTAAAPIMHTTSAKPTSTAMGGVLAETGASRTTLPYVGIAVSLMLLGVSAFLLIGRRRPRVR